jgi:hypothetical protein
LLYWFVDLQFLQQAAAKSISPKIKEIYCLGERRKTGRIKIKKR